ncbi:TRAP transporter large permease subunit [Desulfovibrio sp. ZJ369]|uniref:TRAP transporter large permease n=1 Tax=Desulfovibrio sp. ZJ369 TaxID=2709793 RepID=UPI0013ED6666|nr:TRAP transporter large permease subunit [Desulfovibrio sp. ZJ369]
MSSTCRKFLRLLDADLEKPFLVIGLLLMILIITYQTLYRYSITQMLVLLDAPAFVAWFGAYLPVAKIRETVSNWVGLSVWSEETARYLFIWISYLAIPLAIRRRSNIRVDIIYDRLSPRVQGISWIVVDLCLLALSGFMTLEGLEHVRMQLAMPQMTAALGIPYAIPYLILPLGFGLMSLRALQDIADQLRVTAWPDALAGIAFTALLFAPVFLFEDVNAIALLFGYFIALLLIGVPIAFSLGIAGLMTVLGAGTLPVDYLAQVAFTSIDNFPIMAIPFFIAAGVFMGAGGLSRRLLALADELVGGLAGGMALASIATCMFFAAISGSGPATVAAIGTLTIPAMVERGYDKLFAAAVVAAAGAIGVMIPPSNPFVVYGVAAQASVGKLFLAGITPGVLTGLALMVTAYVIARKNGWRGESRPRNLKSVTAAVWDAKWALLVPVIVLGGIYGGLMTPTEAAAIAAMYGLLVGLFIYRELNWRSLRKCCVESAQTSAVIIMLMSMATIFGNVMTLEQAPERIASAILNLTANKIAILLLINVLLLWVGTFMEALAAIVILTPILLPLVTKVGVDPIHFGVIMVVNLAIGFVTPPVGVNLFVACGITKQKIELVSRAAMPFILTMLAILLLVTFWPTLSLYLLQ